MAGEQPIYDIKYHFVWFTNHRHNILTGKIAERIQAILLEVCIYRKMVLLDGIIGKNYVYMYLSCPPKLSPSDIVRYLKGRSSRLIQLEFTELEKYYAPEQPFWENTYYCMSAGDVTKDRVVEYVNQNRRLKPAKDLD
jgi:putative transposase